MGELELELEASLALVLEATASEVGADRGGMSAGVVDESSLFRSALYLSVSVVRRSTWMSCKNRSKLSSGGGSPPELSEDSNESGPGVADDGAGRVLLFSLSPILRANSALASSEAMFSRSASTWFRSLAEVLPSAGAEDSADDVDI